MVERIVDGGHATLGNGRHGAARPAPVVAARPGGVSGGGVPASLVLVCWWARGGWCCGCRTGAAVLPVDHHGLEPGGVRIGGGVVVGVGVGVPLGGVGQVHDRVDREEPPVGRVVVAGSDVGVPGGIDRLVQEPAVGGPDPTLVEWDPVGVGVAACEVTGVGGEPDLPGAVRVGHGDRDVPEPEGFGGVGFGAHRDRGSTGGVVPGRPHLATGCGGEFLTAR